MRFVTVHIDRDEAYQWYIMPQAIVDEGICSTRYKAQMPESEFNDYMRVLNEFADWQDKLCALAKGSENGTN